MMRLNRLKWLERIAATGDKGMYIGSGTIRLKSWLTKYRLVTYSGLSWRITDKGMVDMRAAQNEYEARAAAAAARLPPPPPLRYRW